MFSAISQPHVIASAERLVDARLDQHGTMLMLVISAIVRPGQAIFDQVERYMRNKCFTLEMNDEYEDDDLMFGRGRIACLKLSDGCPPEPHNCMRKRSSVLAELEKA